MNNELLFTPQARFVFHAAGTLRALRFRLYPANTLHPSSRKYPVRLSPQASLVFYTLRCQHASPHKRAMRYALRAACSHKQVSRLALRAWRFMLLASQMINIDE
ncbi:MAG: hypothetical protein LBF19_02750 [Prevotellaceae bacterium]|nr:hypothetical protein [Prevotellaceae bacterium]